MKALLLAAAACLAGVFSAQAQAQSGYQHRQWTVADGAPLQINSIAQTSDGWLWLGTHDGLYRFDGMRFARYPLAPRPGPNSSRVIELHAGPNGELYLAYAAEGMSVLYPDGRLRDLPPALAPALPVHAMTVDADGSLWIMNGGIQHFSGGRWIQVETAPEWETSLRRSFALDRHGQLWAVNDVATWRLDRASGRFVRMLDAGGDLALAPDGRLWLVVDDGTLRLLAAPGIGPLPSRFGPSEGRYAGQFGPDGALWLLSGCAQAVCVVPDAGGRPGPRYDGARAAPLRMASPQQLSGTDPRTVLVDREGNVWVATENGIDRYRRSRFVDAGLPGTGLDYSLASDGAGRMWAASMASATLWQLLPDGPPRPQPGAPVALIARGPGGSLLVGERRAIERRGADTTERIALPPGPDGKPADMRMFGILDDGRVLWTATPVTGLIGWRDGAWLPHTAFRLPPKIFQSAPGGPGQLWLATGDGKLFLYDGAGDTSTSVDIGPLGTVSAIFPGAEVVLSGDGGMGIVRGGALHMLRAADPAVLRNVSGQAFTADGDRWFNGAAGLLRVRAADWRRSSADPAVPLRYELFDALDGYPGRAVIETRWASAWSPDGRNLWLATTGPVVRFDTGAIARNPVAPTPVILRIATDDAAYESHTPIVLPPGTDRFRIDYTAPALGKPERIRFEYRLDGVDHAWQDAGNRRATSYTNIGPGDYVFRLRAFNEDGVASLADSTLALTVAPTLVQRTGFRLLCLLAVLLLGVALYRYRVRYLTARLAERLRVKTAERERIARTLHDTFLQTVQGLVLRVDAVAAALAPGDRTRTQLESVLEDAGRAIGEGRDQLQGLRAGDAVVLDDMLEDAAARLRALHGIAIEVHVSGDRRPLHPDVASEAADIAREALRNACLHAQARRIVVTLAYGRKALALSVADDGRGIPADVLRHGARDGHWGLPGMRERAARIGARLDIGNGTDGGALLTLHVPASRAYAPSP